jgi:hypothetical protein
MSTNEQRVCVGCGDTEDQARLERCGICTKWFCTDCSHRTAGRRFCSSECGRAYFWGDDDDDKDAESDDD